ncbi:MULTISPECIES: hypothetical protein [unclassified Nocardiopsis]|uniref:hypothetical protein n=1 Tax=Nocardiopsis TaxID=2013 RepID=UPI00387ADB91
MTTQLSDNAAAVLSPVAARVHGIALVLGPLLLFASTVAFITVGDGINNGVLGGTVSVWACMALTLGFVGLFRALEPVAPRAAPALMALAVVSFVAGTGFSVLAIQTAVSGGDYMTGELAGETLIAFFALFPWGLFGPLMYVLTGILLWRTRAVPRWSAVLVALGGILFVLARPERIDVLAVVCDITLIAALVPLGWSMAFGARTPVNPVGPARTPAP